MRRLAVALASLLAIVGWTATPALAHADLVASDPADGATVPVSPTSIRLTFSERPDPSLSAVAVLDAGGAPSPTRPPELVGRGTLTTPIEGALPPGTYTVTWRVVSTDDGHVTSGAFAFGVGTAPATTAAAGPTTTSGPTPLAVASKAALYAGSMLLVAIAVVALGLFHDAPRSRRWLGLAAGIAAFAGALGFLIAQQRSIGVPMGAFLDSEAGRDPRAIAVVCLLAAGVAAIAARSHRRWPAVAAGALGAIALGLRAHGGHAAAAALPVVAEVVQWVHMLAAACWAGGLLLLVLLVREHAGGDPPMVEARRYSRLAVGAIAVVVASGLVRAVSELGGPDDLGSTLGTSYGRTLATKVGVVLVVIALGAWNRLRGIDRLATDPRPMRRVAATELVAIVAILALTATLTSLAPPAAKAARGEGPVTLTASDFATTVTATLSVSPGLPGANAYRAHVVPFGTDEPWPADDVTLRLRSVTEPALPPAALVLRPDGDAWVGQALAPSVAGTYAVALEIRAGAEVTVVPMTLTTGSTGAVAVGPSPSGETLVTATFPDGARIQASSSAAPPTQVHLTAFAPDGGELPLSTVTIVAIPDDGRSRRLRTTRFGPGHVIAGASLALGTWTFDAVATAETGETYQLTWRAAVS